MKFSRRFGWVAVLLGGFAVYELLREALVKTENPIFIPALLLIGATVVPAAFVTFWWGRRLAANVLPGCSSSPLSSVEQSVSSLPALSSTTPCTT